MANKYIIVGDKKAYIMEAEGYKTAWECAEKELAYGITGNTKIKKVIKR